MQAENLPPTEKSLNPVEIFGNKPEENADTATVMVFEAGGNPSSGTEDTNLMFAVDPSVAVAQNVVSREDPMTEAESSMQPVLDTSSEVPKVSVSDDIGQASQFNLKEREEACRVGQSASLGNSDDDLVTQALEPQTCTAMEKHLSAEVPISSSKVFIEDQNLMEESHGIDHAVKTSLVPEDLVEKDDPLQAGDLGTHKGGISEPEIGLISDPVIRHEEESQAFLDEATRSRERRSDEESGARQRSFALIEKLQGFLFLWTSSSTQRHHLVGSSQREQIESIRSRF
ncbi:hypothetical protein Droror1_Dr00015618 [Drosera rotundifolia]